MYLPGSARPGLHNSRRKTNELGLRFQHIESLKMTGCTQDSQLVVEFEAGRSCQYPGSIHAGGRNIGGRISKKKDERGLGVPLRRTRTVGQV